MIAERHSINIPLKSPVQLEQYALAKKAYLERQLQNRGLPLIVKDMIRKAIKEYDSAFGKPISMSSATKSITHLFQARLLNEEEEGIIRAGEYNLLTVRFIAEDKPGKPTEDIFTHLAVHVRTLPRFHIYPDTVRYIAVDAKGNSQETPFLIAVPGNLRNVNGQINLEVRNGQDVAMSRTTDLYIR